jgi:hypothetical protein
MEAIMRTHRLPLPAILATMVLIAFFVAIPVKPVASLALPVETGTATFNVDLANNSVTGGGWTQGSPVTIQVWNSDYTQKLKEVQAPVGPDINGSSGAFSYSFGQPYAGGWDITNGMIVVVTDGSTTKVMSDTNLRMTQFDVLGDQIYGQGAIAPVQICSENRWSPGPPATLTSPFRAGCAFGLDFDQGSGSWSWDLTATDQAQPANYWHVNLMPHVFAIQASQTDATGDSMGSEGSPEVPWPHLVAPANGNGPVLAFGYPLGTSVSLTATFPDAQVRTSSATVVATEMGDVATFSDIGRPLVIGTQLSASGQRPGTLFGDPQAPVVSLLTVRSVQITSVNIATDVVTGTAWPSADVEVTPYEPSGGGQSRHVQADANGLFSVNFALVDDLAWIDNPPVDLTAAGQMRVDAFDDVIHDDFDLVYAQVPNVVATINASPTTYLSGGQNVHVWGDGFAPNASVGIAEAFDGQGGPSVLTLGNLPTNGSGHYDGYVTVQRDVNGTDMSTVTSGRLVAYDPGNPYGRNAAVPISFLPPVGNITIAVNPTATVSAGGWVTVTGTATCVADGPMTVTVQVWQTVGRKSVATGTATIEVKPCWTGQTVTWQAVVKPSGSTLVPFGTGTAQVQVTATQNRYGDHAETTISALVKIAKAPKPSR